MEVHGHRVRQVDPVEQVAAGGGDQQPAAVRGVHVHPHVVAAADLADRAQRVDRAVVRGAGQGHDGRDLVPGVRQRGQHAVEGGRIHPVAVAGQRHHGVRGQAQQARGLDHAEVGVLAGDDPQARQPRAAVAGVVAPRCRPAEPVLAGGEQALEVGRGAAGREHPVGAPGVVEPDEIGDPVDELLLDEAGGRALVPRLHGGVHRRRQGLGGDGGDRDGTVQVREVARMVVAHRVVEVELADLLERLVESAERGGQVDGRGLRGQRRRRRRGSRRGPTVEVPADLGGRRRQGRSVGLPGLAAQQWIVHGYSDLLGDFGSDER